MTLTDEHRATVEAVLKNRDILKDEQAVLANAAPLLKATILEQMEEIERLKDINKLLFRTLKCYVPDAEYLIKNIMATQEKEKSSD
jgi:hypothetical protein